MHLKCRTDHNTLTCTSYMSERRKMIASPRLELWVSASPRLELWVSPFRNWNFEGILYFCPHLSHFFFNEFYVLGPLIKEMVNNLQQKKAGTMSPDRKVHVYSAHDTTVSNLLQGLGVFNFLMPPYFSTVLMELRKKDTSFFVTVSILFKY